MATQTVSPPHTASQGTKRSAEDSHSLETTPTKRLRHYHHHHAIHYKQPSQADPMLHCQDEQIFQGQLDRSLATMLCSAGFDTATPDAFEALRSSTQEFMLHFASIARKGMLSSRRNQPLPQDFVLALADSPFTSSDLLPHTSLSIPPDLALPPVLAPPPDEVKPPVLDPILGNDLNGKKEQTRRPYISKIFPTLPSRHTWKTTPVFPAREADPRKIRERATREGVLAEQALRKLAAKRKQSAPQHRGGGAASRSRAEAQKKRVWEDALAHVLQDDQEEQKRFEASQYANDDDGELVQPQKNDDVAPSGVEDGLLVNYDRKNWRRAPGAVIRV